MSIRKELNGTYTVIAYSCGKQVWRRGIKTKKEAYRIELDIKSSNEASLIRKHFHDLMCEFFAHQRNVWSIATIKTYESRYKMHIQPYIGNQIIQNIKTKDILRIMHTLTESEKAYANTYLNTILELLQNAFNYAIDMGYINSNPAKSIKRLKKEKQDMKYVTLNDYQKIHQALDYNPMYQAFIELLYFTGIRLGEARALQYRQISFEDNTIEINAHVVDKGGKRRLNGRKNNRNYTIMMPKNVRTSLETIFENESIKDDFSNERYVFGFYDSWSYSRIARMYKKALQDAGLENYKIHSLRHGYASLLANSGATIQELAATLGDSLEVTINTYTHMYSDINKKINNRVNQIIADSPFFNEG